MTSLDIAHRTRRRLAAVTTAALVAGSLAAVATAMAPDGPADPPQAALAAASADDHINHVVGISVDGLNPDAIRRLGPSGAPYLHRLLNSGATTLNARTAVESTSTLPNHASMLTSRKVARSAAGHGVLFNDNRRKVTVHKAAGRYVPSVFDVVHDAGGSTALYTSKAKFALFNRTWNRKNGAVDRTGANNGRDKIGAFVYRRNENRLVSAVRKDLLSSPNAFTFVHLSQTDKVGHASGYMSAKYLAAVRAVDTRIGVLMNTISRNARLKAHAAIVLTSDHGGYGKSHSTITSRVNYTVPFMVWGKGIARSDLYAVNPGYRDPGTSRVGYAGAQPVRNAALGNVAADLLDRGAIPGSQINARLNLNVFR